MTYPHTLKDHINFVLTNLPPRRALSRWMGRLSKIENRAWTRMALWIWNRFDPLEFDDTVNTCFKSVRDCFIRPLKPGARRIDIRPDIWTSPCDGIVGAQGRIQDGQLFQIKGKNYRIEELIGQELAHAEWTNGHFMTIRIKSGMYHRFHAPADGKLLSAKYFSGDAFNVNPPALRWVDRLYCKNERACLTYQVSDGDLIALIPVAAILVAGIQIPALSQLDWGIDQKVTQVNPAVPFEKGQEMGWFEHGSTIVILTPAHWAPLSALKTGDRLLMGQALFQRLTPAA
jgi:phosphatidylserine decarboxylase